MTMSSNEIWCRILEMLEQAPFKSSMLQYLMEEGLFSREGLESIITSSKVLERINKSRMECFVTVSNVHAKKMQVEYLLLNKMKKEDVVDTLLASSALPLIYGKRKVEGEKCRDGGLKDNVPIEPLYASGCTNILVVQLNNPLFKDVKKGLMLLNKEKSKIQTQYKGARVYIFYPPRDLKGLWGTLDFSPKTIKKLIDYGYKDTTKFLSKVDGC